MKTITFVTGNKNKLKEILSIVGENPVFQIIDQKIDLPEYQGDFRFIVEEKCKEAAKIVKGPVLVEDTSLNIAALNGLPGPYIKWFIEALGPSGLVRMIKDWDDKRATAVCMMAYTESEGQPIHLFEGRTEGCIVQPKGSLEFGWDPCFQPDNCDQTFGEMGAEMKDSISHRFLCTKKLKEFLEREHNLLENNNQVGKQ